MNMQPRAAPFAGAATHLSRRQACGAFLTGLTLTLAAALWALAAAPSFGADMAAGKRKAQACAPCHGIDGVGKNPTVPNIAGESEIYLASQLEAFRSGKRSHEQMSIIAKSLSDEDIADLAAWYAAIDFSVKLPQ